MLDDRLTAERLCFGTAISGETKDALKSLFFANPFFMLHTLTLMAAVCNGVDVVECCQIRQVGQTSGCFYNG